MGITFLACSHELYLLPLVLHLSRPEVAEYADVCSSSQSLGQFLCHLYARAYHQAINILGRSLQEEVSDESPHHIALHS